MCRSPSSAVGLGYRLGHVARAVVAHHTAGFDPLTDELGRRLSKEADPPFPGNDEASLFIPLPPPGGLIEPIDASLP